MRSKELKKEGVVEFEKSGSRNKNEIARNLRTPASMQLPNCAALCDKRRSGRLEL